MCHQYLSFRLVRSLLITFSLSRKSLHEKYFCLEANKMDGRCATMSLWIKLAAAATPLLLWFILFGLTNPHDIMAMIVWAAPVTYLYGISVSYVIDWVIRKWQMRSKWSHGLLYLFAGYLFFAILFIFGAFDWKIFVGFGSIGAAVALAFYLSSLFYEGRKKVAILVGIGAPVVLLIAAQLIVFQFRLDKKEGWIEKRTATSYEATYRYFHGIQAVPILAKKGQEIIYQITWKNHESYRSYGHTAQGPDQIVGMEEVGQERYRLISKQDGTYEVIVNCKQCIEGGFTVEWEIRESK